MENSVGFIEDAFFVTRTGLFGRAPASAVKVGHRVVVLGGAYVPYLLERQRGRHFELVSHAYVQGIMSMSKLPSSCRVERFELK